MIPKFIKLTYLDSGQEWEVIVNTDEIARLSYGFNFLELKTPFPNGTHSITLSEAEFDRVTKLLGVENNELIERIKYIMNIALQHANPYENQGMVEDFHQIHSLAEEVLNELQSNSN